MSCHVFLPDGDKSKSGQFLAGEVWAELHPELLFYIHEEGNTWCSTLLCNWARKKRRGREVWGLQLSTTYVGDLPDDTL